MAALHVSHQSARQVRSSVVDQGHQACDLSNLEATVTMQQEVAQEATGIVVGALRLAEAESAVEQRLLLGREALFGDLRLLQPNGECVGRCHHESASRAM